MHNTGDHFAMRRLTAILLLNLAAGSYAAPAMAHQIDEYVANTHVEILRDRIRVFLSLTPGSALAARVIARIDTDHDGRLSEAEKLQYATSILNSFALAVDDARLTPQLIGVTYPAVEEMLAGQGIIQLKIEAPLRSQSPGRHSLFLANNAKDLTVFVAAALVPPVPEITISRQDRDSNQRRIEIEYAVARSRAGIWVLTGLLIVPLLLWAGIMLRRYRLRSALSGQMSA